jgi:hypothetical protein
MLDFLVRLWLECVQVILHKKKLFMKSIAKCMDSGSNNSLKGEEAPFNPRGIVGFFLGTACQIWVVCDGGMVTMFKCKLLPFIPKGIYSGNNYILK